jgi:ubiquinone/menaquinone biosynthesis C-methylase UbiE
MKAQIYRNADYPYSEIFWGKDKNREYEHSADLLVLKNSLTDTYPYIVDLGGGFGRLVPFLKKYTERIILVDSSIDLLEEAKTRFGDDPNVQYVRANLYHLPFRDVSIPAAICIRVMHHMDDPDAFFKELNRVIAKNIYLEFPNKRHLLQWYRFFFKKDESINIFSSHKEMRNRMFYNFTLRFMRTHLLRETIFSIDKVSGISFLRQDKIKRIIPLPVLLFIENALQHISFLSEMAPSMLLSLSKSGENKPIDSNELLICPICYSNLDGGSSEVRCSMGHSFSYKNSILDLYIE